MTWKRASAFKILDRIVIMPVFLIPHLYPVSGIPVYDGPITDPKVPDAVLEALLLSQAPPPDFYMDQTNKDFLKDVRFKSLKAFHKVADKVSIEVKSSLVGDEVLFRPLARAQGGGFETSTSDTLSAPSHDRDAIRQALVAALELAVLAEPKPKPVLPKRSRINRTRKPTLDE
ncbi:hypothetical protein [Microvirga sp. 2TAF3]|uniref:hypothetical protein n=1 Tax=Microvirga sp. 2TAF3 TaxID=3233014 RepID=UPI003F9B57A5